MLNLGSSTSFNNIQYARVCVMVMKLDKLKVKWYDYDRCYGGCCIKCNLNIYPHPWKACQVPVSLCLEGVNWTCKMWARTHWREYVIWNAIQIWHLHTINTFNGWVRSFCFFYFANWFKILTCMLTLDILLRCEMWVESSQIRNFRCEMWVESNQIRK